MAKHRIFGIGPTLFDSNSGFEGQVPFSVVPSAIIVLNEDGTKTFFRGSGLAYDWTNHLFTNGIVTSIAHFSGDGSALDQISYIALPAILLPTHFLGVTFPIDMGGNPFLANDDFIDARFRVGGTIVDTTLYGGSGNDRIYGGNGNDTLFGEQGSDRILGGSGDDKVEGGAGVDYLFGDAGNDKIDGGADYDRLYGGDGNDSLTGGISGDDKLYGGVGSDVLIGDNVGVAALNAGRDVVAGGDGDDVLWGRGNDDWLIGGNGIDKAVYALSSFSELAITKTSSGFIVSSLQEGRDILREVEQIVASDGIYEFSASSNTWNKTSSSGATSVLYTHSAAFLTVASDGMNTRENIINFLPPTAPPVLPQIFNMLGGDDTVTFIGSYDRSLGGDPANIREHGDYEVYGGSGNDVLRVIVKDVVSSNDVSLGGNYYLNGQDGDDFLVGGVKDDVLIGGAGNDNIVGNRGHDTLTGGDGVDTFWFSFQSLFDGDPQARQFYSFGNDTITDFVVGTDKLSLSGTLVSTQIVDNTDGLIVTIETYATGAFALANDATSSGALISSSILLQGVHGHYTLGDLVI
jgi:Ca2+-binding RTX toxin-like protein